MPKQPSMQFYPGDWMKDPAVRACSYAAKGLWVDMLCLMWESPQRGFLRTQTGKPMRVQQIANATGGSRSDVEKLLLELRDNGVYSETDDECIYCRRMVRDDKLTQARRDAGAKGGNPALVNQNGSKRQAKPQANAKQTETPSTSSSSSTSVASISGDPDFSGFANACRELYPDTSDGLIRVIVEECVRVCSEITDEEMICVMRAAIKPRQWSAALFKSTMPEVVRSWASKSQQNSAA